MKQSTPSNTGIKKTEIIQNLSCRKSKSPKPSPKVGFGQSLGNQIGKLDNLVAKGWERDVRETNAVKGFFVKPEEPSQLGPLVPQNQKKFPLITGESLPLDPPPEPPKNGRNI
jgi:hypothetical protein